EELQPVSIGPVQIGELEEVAALRGSRVVDQQVDSSEFVHCRCHDCTRTLRRSQVGSVYQTCSGNRSSELPELTSGPCHECYVHAFRCQRLSDRTADATAGTGDNGDFAFELEVHGRVDCSIRGACKPRRTKVTKKRNQNEMLRVLRVFVVNSRRD